MNALAIFLSGFVLAVLTEDLPKWVKTAAWVFLVVVGILMGALSQFRL